MLDIFFVLHLFCSPVEKAVYKKRDCMETQLKLGRASALEQDETILYSVPSIRYSLSFSSTQVYFSLPLIWRVSISITNRRFFVAAYCFGVAVLERSSWFPDCAPEGNTEFVASVRAGKLPLLYRLSRHNVCYRGRLEVTSRNERRSPLWPSNICMCFYTNDYEHIYGLMLEQMNRHKKGI